MRDRPTRTLPTWRRDLFHACQAAAAGLLVVATVGTVNADHFDDHSGDVLPRVADSKQARKVSEVTTGQLGAIPQAIEEAGGAAFLVAKTNEGNWTKLLLRPAKHPRKDKDALDVILVDRLTTFQPRDQQARVLANRREIHVFPGFGIDLDIGQIVPENTGEDLRFVVDNGKAVLKAVGEVELYAVAQALVPPAKPAPQRFSQGAVEPTEFTGSYTVQADGRWSGKMTLKVDAAGAATGEYLSAQTGRAYPVEGKVGNPANRIMFTVRLPMTEQKFDGYLWTRDRNRISGISYMLDRPFGFLAERLE